MDRLMALSLLGTCLSVSNNITPLLAILQRAKSRQLDQVPQYYLMVNHSCQLFWICYSLRVGLFGLILVNSMTCFLSLVNNIVLRYYKGELGRFLLGYGVFVVVVVNACFFVISVKVNGMICIVLGISSTATMFESVFKAVRMRNYLFVDLKIAFSVFGTGVTWLTYAVTAGERFAMCTSGFSAFMGTLMIITHIFLRIMSQLKKNNQETCSQGFFTTFRVLLI